MHIYKQGQLVADNAHLATIKHGGVVSALDNIYSVFSLGMKIQSQISTKDVNPTTSSSETPLVRDSTCVGFHTTGRISYFCT